MTVISHLKLPRLEVASQCNYWSEEKDQAPYKGRDKRPTPLGDPEQVSMVKGKTVSSFLSLLPNLASSSHRD